jgi:hypothetical protein
MRTMLVILSLALAGACGYIGYLQKQIADLRKDYAVAWKVDKFLANHQGQINGLRGDVVRIAGDYASGAKVNHALNNHQAQINGVRAELTQLKQNTATTGNVNKSVTGLRQELAQLRTAVGALAKPKPAPAMPTHVVELGFRTEEETVVVLRYAGASVESALQQKTLTRPGRLLARAVKVSADDPKAGTVALNHAVVRSPEGARTLSLGKGKPPAVGARRSAPDGADWDLTEAGRKEIAGLLREP